MGESNIVKRITDYIENHLEDDLSLDKLAEELHYSKFYLARVFVGETGCTIYKYIQGRRLTLAARKLVETENPIIEIAYEARYGSQQAFTLAFEQLYLCTPQAYRKRGIFYPVQSGFSIQNAKNVFSYAYSKCAAYEEYAVYEEDIACIADLACIVYIAYIARGGTTLYRAYIDHSLSDPVHGSHVPADDLFAGHISVDHRKGGAAA